MNSPSFDSSDDEADLKRNAPESPPDKPAEKKQNVATSPVKNEEINPLNNDPPPSNEFDDSMSDVLKEEWLPAYFSDECVIFPRYAICCLKCNCTDVTVDRYIDPDWGVLVMNNCGNSAPEGNTYLYHRGCCHKFNVRHNDYLSPMTEAICKLTS